MSRAGDLAVGQGLVAELARYGSDTGRSPWEHFVKFSRRPAVTRVDPQTRARHLADPAFGRIFTDHMVSVRWTRDEGWHDARVEALAPLELHPGTVVLHYAQEVFEGLKAYRQPGGGVALFRPERNAERMARSCRRMALPELPADVFIRACELLVQADEEWVPDGEGTSLYLRPFVFADQVALGIRPSDSARFLVIASPAGNYFSGPLRPISLWLAQDYVRASPGGTGAAKTGGNYAAGLLAQQQALGNDCDQVVFLDAVEHRWVEELGGMNVFLVLRDGTIVTPELSGTILEGVTRTSLIQVARDLGHRVEERRIAIDEWQAGAASGQVVEVFACGTAAVVLPVGALRWPGGEAVANDGEPGPVTQQLRSALLDVQYGRTSDTHGWRHEVPLPVDPDDDDTNNG